MAGTAATVSLINTDKISALVGAPIHSWKTNEQNQIKQIQRCFKNAYNTRANLAEEENNKSSEQASDDVPKEKSSEGEIAVSGKTGDDEAFLPKDSILRSKESAKKVPANPAFKDYQSFLNSCSFDYWRSHFEKNIGDKFLNETAQSIVANICMAQSRNELRVKNGLVPFRKRREHITPLALVLHELKLWATHVLRQAKFVEEDTYQELRCRVKYLDSLAHREIWGDSVVVFGAGMNATAHDKLFRLLLSAKEGLQKAYEYSLRGYNSRSSREKLEKLSNLLKELFLNEMKMVSNRMTLTKKLSEPKTSRLLPADLLKSIENQSSLDVSNMVNVILWKLTRNPLVAASFDGDYEKAEVKAILDDLQNWSDNNLFCRITVRDSVPSEPQFRMDPTREYRMLPQVYRPAAAELKRNIKEADPRAELPLLPQKHISILKKCFESEQASENVVKLMMRNLAAIQELFPSLYAIQQLFALAGDGGDFTVYDTLREHVIRIMSSTLEKVQAVKESGIKFRRCIGKLAEQKETAMRKQFISSGSKKLRPAWVMNHKFIEEELSIPYRKTYQETEDKLYELGKDARDYTLTSEVLDDKVEEAKKIFDAITGYTPPAPTPAPVQSSVVADKIPEAKAVHHISAPLAVVDKKDFSKDYEEFGTNNAFGEKSPDTFDFGTGKATGYDSDQSSIP